MPVTISQNLEHALQRADSIARERGRLYATPEDLLVALIDDEDASRVMQALLIEPEKLRRDVLAYVEGATDGVVDEPSGGPKFTADLQRVLGLAATQVQSSRRQIVTGADLLVELFTEPVGHFLQRDVAVDDAGDSPRLEVFLLNDPTTPMEFVVWVLGQVFHLPREDAIRVMLSTHSNGLGSCGVFGRRDAAELAGRVENLAREHQHPLCCILRPGPGSSALPPAVKPEN